MKDDEPVAQQKKGILMPTSLPSKISALSRQFALDVGELVYQAFHEFLGAFVMDLDKKWSLVDQENARASRLALPASQATPASESPTASTTIPRKKTRKKALPQLCPVPGCKNRAAPAYKMVCGRHKGLSKAKIQKYRDERRSARKGK